MKLYLYFLTLLSLHIYSSIDQDFATLGLTKNATLAEAKDAYIHLVRLNHPDKNIGATDIIRKKREEKSKKINPAYERIKEHFPKLAETTAAAAAQSRSATSTEFPTAAYDRSYSNSQQEFPRQAFPSGNQKPATNWKYATNNFQLELPRQAFPPGNWKSATNWKYSDSSIRFDMENGTTETSFDSYSRTLINDKDQKFTEVAGRRIKGGFLYKHLPAGWQFFI